METINIGVISDTHGNFELMQDAIKYLIENFQIDRIYHLGDNYSDGKLLNELKVKFKIVPGLYDPEFTLKDIPNILIEQINHIPILFTHSLDKIDFKCSSVNKCKIICYGHTHDFRLELIDGTIYFNPGHLKSEYDKNRIATFGVISFSEESITFRIFDIKKNLLKEEKYLCL